VSELKGKKVLLGVTGSIAAYKSLLLVRLLIKAEAEVKVIMTHAATEFVSGLSFSTLSQNQVYTDLFEGNTWNDHVKLGLWADIFIIAPATASTLSKLANGQSDNMLVATYLSAKCPVMIAPAMDLDMWQHPSVRENISKLVNFGNEIIPVGTGFLASGLYGDGRMAEPETILEHLQTFFGKSKVLLGKTVLITAGPTYEEIDPVRFIGNYSSGKMGWELAKVVADFGAEVHLILGPSHIPTHERYDINVIHVKSAQQMYEAASQKHALSDWCIFTAAVADYRIKTPSLSKIKKSDASLHLDLIPNVDIAKELGKMKTTSQLHIGFALGTEPGLGDAKNKLDSKNFDILVANSLADEGAGFQLDTNKVSIIDKKGNMIQTDILTKTEISKIIIAHALHF